MTHWTIRLALAAYVGRVAIDLSSSREQPGRERLARRLWTVGCALLWIHVACAFQFYHHWSHAAAYEQTMRETAEVTGLDWGGGIWINYLLMLLWAGDVAWWWLVPQSHRHRPILLDAVWQAGLAFIVFNATVVFKTGVVRWIGLVTTVTLLALAMRRFRGSRRIADVSCER